MLSDKIELTVQDLFTLIENAGDNPFGLVYVTFFIRCSHTFTTKKTNAFYFSFSLIRQIKLNYR